MCVSRRRPPTCLLPDGSPKFVTIVLRAVHQIVAPGIVEITVLQKANQTQPLKNQQLCFELNEAFLIKRVFLHAFVVLWFGPSTFQNLAIHVSTVRCQYEEFFLLDLNLMSLVPPKKIKRRCPFLKLLKLYRSYVVSTNNCP